MSILNQTFDRTALDTYDAEPEIRAATLSGLGDRETATVEEIIRWMGRADWALCWLTKLGLTHRNTVVLANEIAKQAISIVKPPDALTLHACCYAVSRYIDTPNREALKTCLKTAQHCKTADAPVYVAVWPIAAVNTIIDPATWLHRPRPDRVILVPDEHKKIHTKSIEKFIEMLREV